jgi:hypothetical protein
MAITTDFIGHIRIEPALGSGQVDELVALHETPRGGGRPRLSSGWVASADGSCLTLEGDEKYGDPAEWLRHVIRCFVKPAGLRAEGMVVGCRRDTRELWTIQVAGNRVSERALWPRRTQFREARPQQSSRTPTAQVIDLATRRARA